MVKGCGAEADTFTHVVIGTGQGPYVLICGVHRNTLAMATDGRGGVGDKNFPQYIKRL